MTTDLEVQLVFSTIGSLLGQLFTLTDGMMFGSKSVLDYFIAFAYFETAINFMLKMITTTGGSDSDLKYEERSAEREHEYNTRYNERHEQIQKLRNLKR